ncbi:MAG: Fibronectin type III domain protein [Parcubacteria group bacterium GW2011_GWA2_52_8]|nr:MAG: Fibronectin type III domain protein [Parcubacteria group bacterium GW2011_GWA2_52_8]
MSIYFTSPVGSAPNNQFQVAIYSDVNGAPGILIASSASQTITPDAWNTVPIAATLTPNTFYWLAYNSNGALVSQNNSKFDTGTTGQTVRRSQTFGTWPSSYGTPATTFAVRYSMYVTYGAVTAPPDTTVPTVSLTAPANNASVSGTINITATASDNFGVTNVEFYLDDVLNSTDTSSPYSYSLNTTALTNAAHTITAKAYDAAGNATISSAVTVTVNNAVSPPLHQGIVTASATTATSLSVSNVSAGANSLYLASVPIYSNNYREVKSISGGGLTWSRVKRQCSAKIIQPWMELWSATGSPSSSFTATITLSGSPTRWSAIVSRYTGVDMTTPLEGVTGSNTKGMNTVCPNDGTGIDTVAPSLALTASQSNSVLFVATHTRNKTITIPATGFTQRAFILNTSGGDGANLYVHDRTMATAGRTISAVASSNITNNSATISWTTNEVSDSQVEYGITTSYGNVTGILAAQVTNHSMPLGLLNATTLYHYRVKSRDAAGNLVTSGDFTLTTAATADTTTPTVSISAPAANATVAGTINVTANAYDNIAVGGVQFKLDGANLGSEDTSSPYSASWNTTTATNGSHILSAVARDAAGNATTAANITVTVNNVVVSSSAPIHAGTVTASATTATSLNVTGVSAGANSLYLASVPIYSNNYREVSSISGGGLTWTRVKRQCSARIIQPWMELWKATGSPSGSFTATITLSGAPTRWSAAVSRYTGADLTNPLEGITGSNTKGLNPACPNDSSGVENAAAATTLAATQNNSVLFVATHPRHRTITTPASGFTQRAFVSNTSGGDGSNLYIHERTVTTAGTTNVSHTLNSSTDWDMIGVVIRPAGGL